MKIRLSILVTCYIAFQLFVTTIPALAATMDYGNISIKRAQKNTVYGHAGLSFSATDKSFDKEQFCEEEVDDDDNISRSERTFHFCKFVGYSYIPVFCIENKHFLIHFICSIKDRLPRAQVLFGVFTI